MKQYEVRPHRLAGYVSVVLSVSLVAGLAYSAQGEGVGTAVPDRTTVRTTRRGDVIGFLGDYGGAVWMGVPYAKAPIGRWRWRAPQPAARWAGFRETLAPGSPCSQPAGVFNPFDSDDKGAVGSEDCLYLNIWGPAQSVGRRSAQDTSLPVMVWIHGGGNVGGNGAMSDGAKLAATQNVIVVGVNYRLGPFGWFRHAALRGADRNAAEESGNYGLLDIIQALRWIQENIEAFGGDPRRVTLFGVSAGAQNIYALLASPRAAGLFQHAIIQSGGDLTMSPVEAENITDDSDPGVAKSSNEVLLRLLMADGRAADRNAAKRYTKRAGGAAMAAYLQHKSFADFDRAYRMIATEHGERPSPSGMPQLIRDGSVLPKEHLISVLSQGKYNQMPVLIGTTKDEYSTLLQLTERRGHFDDMDTERFYRQVEYMSQLWKAEGVDAPARAMHRKNAGSVFVYRFDWDRLAPEERMNGLLLGATHGLDTAFVFGNPDAAPEFQTRLILPEAIPSYQALSAAMMSYWAEFARSGDPGAGQADLLPRWLAWGAKNQQENRTMILDGPDRGGPHMSSLEVTRESIRARLQGDTRFESAESRCQFLKGLVSDLKVGWHFTAQDYDSFSRGRCGT